MDHRFVVESLEEDGNRREVAMAVKGEHEGFL